MTRTRKPAAAPSEPSLPDMVRRQAAALGEAIRAARSAGYVVEAPFRVDDLDRVSVSATAKALGRT